MLRSLTKYSQNREQDKQISDDRCVLACTQYRLSYFYLYLCTVTTLSNSDSYTFLFQALAYISCGQTWHLKMIPTLV